MHPWQNNVCLCHQTWLMRMAKASSMQHITLMLTNMASAHGQCIFDATHYAYANKHGFGSWPMHFWCNNSRYAIKHGRAHGPCIRNAKIATYTTTNLLYGSPPPQADCMAGPNLLMPCQFPSAQSCCPNLASGWCMHVDIQACHVAQKFHGHCRHPTNAMSTKFRRPKLLPASVGGQGSPKHWPPKPCHPAKPSNHGWLLLKPIASLPSSARAGADQPTGIGCLMGGVVGCLPNQLLPHSLPQPGK
jgi:hypothetical protein